MTELGQINTQTDVALTSDLAGYVKLDQSTPQELSAGYTPSADQNVATKKYVDDNAGGGGGTPGGADTNVQFNDGGAFGGEAGFVYDKTDKKLGVNKASPEATVHAGADVYTIGNPSSLLAVLYTQLTTGGLPFQAYNYRVYGKRTEKTVDFFSATPATLTTTAYSITPSGSGVPNYTEGYYTGDSTIWNFTVYPLYDSDVNIGLGRDYSIQGDGSGYGYFIEHTITAPNWGTPSGFIVVRSNDNTYQLVAGSFEDRNDSWSADGTDQLATYTQITGLQIDLEWDAATSAEDYRIHNVTQNRWTDKGDTDAEITDVGAWTSGTPTVTPNDFTDTALVADGQAILKEELTHQGDKAGFFNTTPIAKPTGDVGTAMAALGLVTSPTYDPTSIAGTAYRVPFFGADGAMTSDADLIFRSDSVGFGFDKTSVNPTGINADSFNIASQMNFKMLAISSTSGTKNDVNVGNRSHVYSNASGVTTITGFAGGYDGKVLFVTNGQSGTIAFANASTSSSAGNRLMLGTGTAPFTMTGLGPRTYMFIYDATNSFWKLIGGDREAILSSTNAWGANNTFNGITLLNGGVAGLINTKSSAYTTTTSDYIISVTSGTFAITLLAAPGFGCMQWIKNRGTGTVTINTTSSQTIDQHASGAITLAQYHAILVRSTGSEWEILSWYKNV